VLANVKVWTHNSSVRQPITTSITPISRENVVIVLRDTGNRPNIRAKHYLSQQPSNTKLIEIESLIVDDLFTADFIKDLTAALGGYDSIIRISSIEPPAKVTVNSQGKQVKVNYTRPTCYVKGSDRGGNIRNWTKCYDDLVDNVEDTLYVTIQDMAIMNPKETSAVETFDTLQKIFDDMPAIYGIREGDLKKIKDMTNYVNVVDYVEKRMQQLRDDRSMFFKWRRLVRGATIFKKFNYYLTEDNMLKTLIAAAPKSPAVKYLKAQKKYSQYSSEYKLLSIAELMGWKVEPKEQAKLESVCNSIYQRLAQRYAFLTVYSDWQVRQSVKPDHLAKYLSSM